MAIKRGTTPVFKIKVKNLDLSMADCYMTFEQKGITPLTKKHVEIDDGNVAKSTLTQEETLQYKCSEDTGKPLRVQLRMFKDGRAFATDIFEVDVEDVLLDEVIPLGD